MLCSVSRPGRVTGLGLRLRVEGVGVRFRGSSRIRKCWFSPTWQRGRRWPVVTEMFDLLRELRI